MMALIMKDGKEFRVPGRAIPEAQRREGALGKMDAMPLGEFRKLPLLEKQEMLEYAVLQKRGAQIDELVKAEFLDVLEGKASTVHFWGVDGKKDASGMVHYTAITARMEFPVAFYETPKATVLFAMPMPTGDYFPATQAKYIILKTPKKDYVVAIPVCVAEYHEDAVRLFRYALKTSKNIDLPEKEEDIRGGYVYMMTRRYLREEGGMLVKGRSEKYGEGPHAEVRALLGEAVRSKLDTLLKTCREKGRKKGFVDLEAALLQIAKE